ncbi:MAG TPA: chemotaxis protein CheW [Polyangiaceae bacterium]|nr:chemotaxis protein CheW [Polyangiaceae bacterium]
MSYRPERPDPQKSLVGFVVGDVSYAVPIDHVREIVNPLPITELPHAPHTISGVADHRGEIVPVVELRARFGLPALSDSRRGKWILIDVAGRGVALCVDRVTEVFGTGGADLKPAPALGSGDDLRGIAGVVSRSDGLTFILDVGEFDVLTSALSAARLLAASEGRR